HSQLKTGHPVRSAIHKQLNGRLVLRWVTTWESLLLYVLVSLLLLGGIEITVFEPLLSVAILEEKQDHGQINDTGSRLSTLLPTKLMETMLIISSSAACKVEDDMAGEGLSATSFDDMQRSVQIIGLPKPEKSKPRLSHHFESEHIIINHDAVMDDPAQGPEYDSEPQMQYLAPSRSNALTPEYRELAIADMAEDIVVLSGHHKLTFLEEGDSEGTEEGTIMVQEVVGMAEVVIQVVGRITHRDRCWSDGMAGFAVVVKEPLSGCSPPLMNKLGCLFRVNS
ncbi:hypothetical protein KCU71_g11684, partial [Aureobasidium melanogenum]